MISYAITDPSTLSFDHLDRDLERFSQKADMIVYRDKENNSYAQNAQYFIERALNYRFDKILLHGDYQLAETFKADGVHLTSRQFDKIVEAKSLGLFVVISCHTQEEAIRAQAYGVDMITFSPIFATPNKGTPLGTLAIDMLSKRVSLPIIALGGIITQGHIDACKANGASGFASIRYFL